MADIGAPQTRARPRARTRTDSGRPWPLVLIASTQFVLVLDITIVTVALPTIQVELGFAQAELQWLVTSYALTFGGFLLLAGRAADVFGHLAMFISGILLFGAASLAAGLAVNDVMLVAARAGQGLGGAAVAPAALALLTTTYPEGRERNRALGVFGAVASAGGASGLILGGVITEWAGWRWVFLVNVPIAVVAAVAAPFFLPEVRIRIERRLDVLGASSITVALVAFIYGLARGDQAGFTDPVALTSLGAASVFGILFVVAGHRAVQPLIPVRILRQPTVLGTDLTSFAASAIIASTPFFLTLYMQRVLEMSPVQTGLAFLPMALTIMGVSALVARLAERLSVKRLLLAGLAALALGMLLLSRMSTDGGYLTDVLPGMTFFAAGLAASYTTATIGGTAGVRDADQGIAGGLLNTFNQVGGAVGLAVLAAVATNGGDGDGALVAGLSGAFLASLAFAALGVLAAAGLIRAHDCEQEVARRTHDDAGKPPTTTAGCLAGLGEQIIDAR